MKIKVINHSPHPLPAYETAGSAGLDLRAWIHQPIELLPLERNLIPTGIFIELPLGYEAQIRPRSGLAVKKGLTMLNAPGTIDSDYRGELKVLVTLLQDGELLVKQGDRIAQALIAPVLRVTHVEVKDLSSTERGVGGFGSTGLST